MECKKELVCRFGRKTDGERERERKMKTNVDERDIFDLSGPTHLSGPQWHDANYKRVVMGCLVESVYVMEKDRQLDRQGIYALAPKWWSSFDYEPIKFIHDEQSEQIVGAVFRWSGSPSPSAPAVVVAFRGTLPLRDTLQSDLTTDLFLILQQLHTTARYRTALAEIKHAIHEHGVANVCVSGHSLGAALCLLAGRTLAEDGFNIDAHLFSPPFASAPLERIKNHKLQLALQVLRMTAVAGLAGLLQDDRSKRETSDAFLALKNRYPHLYVNVHDPICSSYIGYFTSRQFMLEIGGGTLAQLAAPLSLRGIIQQSLFGECRPYHLIPSAHFYVIEKSSKKFMKVHGMHQWWSPNYEIHYRRVSFDIEEYAEHMNMEQSG